VNSQCIYSIVNGTNQKYIVSFDFGIDLINALVIPEVRRRSTNPNLNKSIRNKISLVLSNNSQADISGNSE